MALELIIKPKLRPGTPGRNLGFKKERYEFAGFQLP